MILLFFSIIPLSMKILFICTHNRCRSILSEAIVNHYAAGKLVAQSAGSQPAGAVHPLTIQYLDEAGIETRGLKSQSWDEFEEFEPDIVITVCDSAAKETCPVWFGKALKLHWGLSDPSKLKGTDEQVAAAFRHTIAEITSRTKALLKLPLTQLDQAQLLAEMEKLGASAH